MIVAQVSITYFKIHHNSISSYQFNTKYWNSYLYVTTHGNICRDIDGNFSAQDSLLQLILLLARPATPTGLYAETLLVTQKYLQVECNSRATGNHLVSFY
jgi:hypothetical protein